MPRRAVPRANSARQRVVIDTNVWISAWLSAQGVPAQVVRRAILAAEIVFSPATFDELQTRIWRPKFDRYLSLERRQQLLHDVAAIAHWAQVPAELANQPMCRDPGDDCIVHASMAGKARWLVSGDQDLLSMAASLQTAGIGVLAPAAALNLETAVDRSPPHATF